MVKQVNDHQHTLGNEFAYTVWSNYFTVVLYNQLFLIELYIYNITNLFYAFACSLIVFFTNICNAPVKVDVLFCKFIHA